MIGKSLSMVFENEYTPREGDEDERRVPIGLVQFYGVFRVQENSEGYVIRIMSNTRDGGCNV